MNKKTTIIVIVLITLLITFLSFNLVKTYFSYKDSQTQLETLKTKLNEKSEIEKSKENYALFLRLLSKLKNERSKKEHSKPILLKIAPDLTNEQLEDIISIVTEVGIDGVIATNTTISRENLKSDQQMVEKIGAGGVSGKPLTSRSTEVIAYLHQKSNGAFPIIGVGGIHSPKDALEKLNAGASLVQLYTGFIYEGPGLVKKINKELLNDTKL